MFSDDELVIIIPILRRAHRVVPVVESIRAATPGGRILFVATPGDTDVIRQIEAVDGIADYALSPWPADGRADYARKINMGYRVTSEPLLFLGADDLHFTPGWLDECWSAIVADTPDDDIPHVRDRFVVGTNDLGNPRTMAGLHSTHSLVSRQYVDDMGTVDRTWTVLSEAYWHECVDDEFVATAQHRRCYVHAHKAIVRHDHPDWGRAPMDDLYAANRRQRLRDGRLVFARRRHLWT